MTSYSYTYDDILSSFLGQIHKQNVTSPHTEQHEYSLDYISTLPFTPWVKVSGSSTSLSQIDLFHAG
jgi:hypothetical protein